MKKTLALVLAAVMTAGMTTVAFADMDELNVNFNLGGATYVYADRNDNNVFGEAKDGDNNGWNSAAAGSAVVAVDDVDGGVKIAVPIAKANANKTGDKEDIKNLKVDAEWTVGDLAEKPEIELVKFDGEGYYYAVTFTLPENDGTKKADLQGTLTLYTSSSEKKNPDKLAQATVNFEYGYKTLKLSEWETAGDLIDAEIVDFSDEEDEITLDFGDMFTFEVNVTGQGKLNLVNNTDYNKEFAEMYDYANIDFITFEKEPTFNKNGVAYIYADEDAFIYEVTADGAKEIAGLKWDEDYEAWTFKTRTLKSYAISDVELTEKTATEDKDDTTTDGGKENPDTGR